MAQSSISIMKEGFARHAFLVEECKRLQNDILQGISNDTFQVDIGHVEMRNSDFRTKSTVGIIVSDCVVDDMVVGGPAFNCRQIDQGGKLQRDTILKIDGTTVTPETISAHLVGSDVPGSTVRMTISHQGSIKDVSLKRMDSHVIAGKLKISELFTSMKEKALDSNVPEFADIVNKCIDSWKGDIVNEAEREAKQTYNFHLLQEKCSKSLAELKKKLEDLEVFDLRSASAGQSTEIEELRKEIERSKAEHKKVILENVTELEDSRRQCRLFEAERAEAQEKVQSYEKGQSTEIEELRKEIERNKAEHKKVILENVTELEDSRRQCRLLEAERTKAQEKLHSYEKGQSTEIEELRKEIERIKAEHKKVILENVTELEDSRRQYPLLEAELTKAQEKLQSYEKGQSTEIEELRKEIECNKAEHKKVILENVKELEDSRRQCRLLEAELTKAQEKLQEAQQQGTSFGDASSAQAKSEHTTIEQIHDAIYPKTTEKATMDLLSQFGLLLRTTPTEKVGKASTEELVSHAIEGAIELNRRIKHLAYTQDLLETAMQAVWTMHDAACGEDVTHILAGVGVQVTADVTGFRIKKLLENSAAQLVSGSLLEGDRLLAIDGQDLAEKTLREVSAMLMGSPGTKVTIEGQREKRPKYVVTLRRSGREGTSMSAPEMCTEALEAIKKMRQQESELNKTKSEMRNIEAALRDAQAAAKLHETNAQNLQEDVDKLKRWIDQFEQKLKGTETDLEQSKKDCRDWQSRAQEREHKVYVVTSEKDRLTAALEKATRELQDNLREIESQRSALDAKADVERKLQKSILETHEVRGEVAKARAQVADGETEIKRLATALLVVKQLEAEIADLKERLRVAHRRLTESEEDIIRLRPFEKCTPGLEKKLQDKVVELSNTAESLLKCERDLREAARREMDLKDELKRISETLNNMEVELKKQLAIATARIDVLENALRERDQEISKLSMQLQRSQFDLDAREVIIKQGLDREKIQDQKNSQIQRTAAEQVNKIADLERQLEITKRIPALQKEVERVNDMAKQKQDDLLKTLNAIDANANELSKEVERQKKVDSMLFEARERETKQMQELDNCKINIKMLKDSLQSKDAEIGMLKADFEAQHKKLVSTNTQVEMTAITCNGLKKESETLKMEIRILKQEIEQLRSASKVLQGNLSSLENSNKDLTNKANLCMQENRVDKQTLEDKIREILRLQDELRALNQKLLKSEENRTGSDTRAEDLTRQVHELKGTVARLEMRIRALESEKGGMALEKGGLADQLAKLDADFRALEAQLSDTRNACLESKERESQLQALLKALQDKHDRSVQEAAENASAGKLLLDACKGYVAEHRGVGMVVIAILRQANITSLFGLQGVETDIVINELLPGGPAANCGQIQIGDILIAVDGKKVQGVTVEEVKKLVLGPEGTTASLTLRRPSLTGGARYTLNLVRGDSAKNRSYADEAKEAIDTLSHVYEESRSLVKKNEEVLAMLAEAKKSIHELDVLSSSQNRAMQQLGTELVELRAKLAATASDLKQTQDLLGKVKDEHATCEIGRNSLERTVAELKSKIKNYESRLAELGNEKSGNAERLARLAAELRESQEKFERAQAAEKNLRSGFETREREMKGDYDTLQARYEKVLQECSDKEAAGRGLLNSAAGYLAEKAGVGMVVRTVADGGRLLHDRQFDFMVKQIIPGGSASKCEQIQIYDIIVAVDGNRIVGLPIEKVQDLILGPVGTTVTITGLKVSPTGGERYSVKLMRGNSGAVKPFADEALEAMDALKAVHYEAEKFRDICKNLEDQVSELKARISELESAVSSRDFKMSQLNKELDTCNTKLASSDKENRITQKMLDTVKEEKRTCEEGHKELNKTIAELRETMKALQTKISNAESLKKDFDDSCKREKDLRLEIAKLQAEYEAAKQKASDKERLKKDLDDSCNRERDLKLEIAKLQAEYEAVKQKASDKESAGYKLLDAISGHVAERKGIGMVVRIESSKPNGEYQVKQLIPGGSASKSPIKVGDIITEVDSNPISKLPIEQVQNLILGPEGTNVTITGIANGKRYSETLVRGEAHHTRPFEIEAKEAIDAFNNKHHQAQEAIESKKKLEDLLAAAKIEISELEKAKERGLRSAEQAASLAKQLEQSNGQIAKLETDLTKERSSVAKLSSELNVAQKDSLTLKQEMQNSTQVLRAEIKSKLESSEKEFSSLMKRCKELEQTNGQIAKLEMDLTKERSLVTKLSSELKAAQEDSLKLKAEMQKSIQVFRTEISHLSKLESKLESSEKEVSSLIKKCKENESLGAKMAEALEALYATTEALRGQNMQQCGVGMIVKVDDRGDTCSVTSLTPGGPASACGVLECGDTIITINGQDIRGLSCALVQEQVMGPAGTIISLTGTHINSEPFSVELVRGAHVGNHRSQSVDEMTQGNIATAKGLHKEIARLSRAYAEAQQQVQTLKSEADYAERREEALRLSLRGIEQEHVSTSGSLQTRMREIELVENELHECQMRLAAAEAKSRNETVRCNEYENANARLGKQISDLTIELEKQQSLTMTLDKQVGAKKIETKILSDQLETIQNEKQHLEIRIQTLYAQLRDLENQNEVSQRKLVLAASARLELEEIRRMQHEELTVLKESSISALGSLADAERDMSTLKRNVAETHAEYVKQVTNYHAQLAKEREMTIAIEQQLEIAKVKVSSCRRLLDVMSGYEVQRAGVGILVRTHPHVTGYFSVKELFEGGSAAHSEKIKIGDTLLEVDGIAVKGMPIDSVQNLIVGPVGSAVTIKCHSDGGVATAGDSEPNRNSDLFASTENLFALFANRTIRSSIDPDKGYFYTVTLIRGEIWAQKDNLWQQTETACDRVRALLAEHIEAKKIIQSLMLDMNTRQRMLVQARSELQQVCERVNIPLEEEQPSCEAASLYREDPFWKSQTLTFSDDSSIISFDRTQTEIVASRLRATNVLSDLMKMAELGLQSYQVQRCSLEDKAQALMTAEARITHQSENINDLQEKLANTNTTLNQALSESHVQLADLKILEKVTSELRTEKNEKTQAIVDLKQELANALEQKQASISNCNELSKKVGLLEIQLKEAEMIVAQRGEAISHMQDKLAETEAAYVSRLAKVEGDNEALSKDLVEQQQTCTKLVARCEQQMTIISEVRNALESYESKLKMLGEENVDLKDRLQKAEEDSSAYRARLHGALEEHADKSAKSQLKYEASVQEQERLRRDIENIRREKNARDLYVSDVEGKMASSETLIADLQRDIALLQDSQRLLQEQYEKTDLRRIEVEAELDEKKVELNKVKSRYETLAAEENSMRQQLNATREELERSKRMGLSLHEEKLTLEKNLETSKKHCTATEEQLEAKQKANQLLEKKWKRLEEMREEKDRNIAGAKAEIEKLKKEIENIQKQHNSRLEALAAEEESVKQKLMAALEELERSKRIGLSVQEEKQTMENYLATSNTKIEELQIVLEAKQKAIAILEKKLKFLEEVRDQKEQELARANAEVEKYKQGCEDRQKQLDKAAARVEEQMAMISEVRNALESSEAMVQKLSEENTHLKGRLQKAEVEAETNLKAYRVLEKELEDRHTLHHTKVGEYEAQFSSCAGELDELRANKSFLEQKERQSNEDARVNKMEAEKLRDELRASKSEADKLRDELQRLKKQVDELKTSEAAAAQLLEQKERQRDADARKSKTEAEKLRDELRASKSDAEKLRDELQRLKTRLDELKATEAATAQKLKESTSECLEAKKLLHSTREKLNSEEAINRKMTNEIEELKGTEKQNLQIIDVTSKKLDELKGENAATVRALQTQSDKLKTEEAMTRKLTAELLELRKLYTESERLFKQAEQKNVLLGRQIEEIKDDLAKQKASCKNCHDELEKSKRQSTSLKQEIEMLRAAKDACGVGLLITERHPHRVLTVVEGGSAAASGEIMEGDVITGIDGKDVEAQDIKVVRGMLLGRVGSRVNLAIQRGLDQKYEVTVIRGFKNSPPSNRPKEPPNTAPMHPAVTSL